VRSVRVLLIAALVCATSSVAHARVSSMQLVAPNVGWATTGGLYGHSADKLFWTTDGGAHWRDITPKLIGADRDEGIENVSFRDGQTGWVLFCCGQSETTGAAGNIPFPRYDLAKTTDAGATWSIARVGIPADACCNMGDANGGSIDFADSMHGWLYLSSCGGHTCGGPLLATSDGGRTWRVVESGGAAFSMVTPKFGWSLDIPNPWEEDEGSLSVTHDGAKSWQKVSVPFPKEMISAADARQLTRTPFYHDLPTFKDSEHGFLPVTYLAQRGDGNSAIVLFETKDGGQTWNPIRTLTKLYIPGQQAEYTVEVADSTLVAATSSRDDRRRRRVILSRVGPGGRTDTDISFYLGGSSLAYLQLSFATPKQGWMESGGDLLSTSNGGATWTKLDVQQETTTNIRERNHATVDAMQLIGSNVGWTLTQACGLCRTQDGGAKWTAITPRGLTRVSDAFFLTADQGWALDWQGSRLVVFSTTNGGADWTITNVTFPSLQQHPIGQGIQIYLQNSLPSQIYFEDSLHGWISLSIDIRNYSNQSTVQQAAVLATSDGGRTWVQVRDVGRMGYLRFATPTDGWMLVPPGDELYVTHDGAKSWTKVSLAAPKEVYPANEATYDLPTFQDSKHGFLPVTYSGGLGVNAAVLLFATDDGGQSWKPNRTLTGLSGMPAGTSVSSTVAGSNWILANVADDAIPTLTTIANGGTAIASSNVQPGYYGTRQLSFATPSQGWLLLRNGRLLVTADGGSKWSELAFGWGGQAPTLQALQAPSSPESISLSDADLVQLITPDIGWAVGCSALAAPPCPGNRRLYRTEDGGATWKSIMPTFDTASWRILSVFFLDSDRGWALLRLNDRYVAYSTVNGGADWSAVDLGTKKDQAGPSLSVWDGQIFFVNSLEGWIDFTTSGPHSNSLKSELFMTSDGGRTWAAPESQGEPPPGQIRFISPAEGWLLSRSRTELLVTRDGAKSWQQVSLSPPTSARASGQAIYDLPTFKDSKNGFLPVIYGGSSVQKSVAVLYATVDGGENWKPDRTLAKIGDVPLGDFVSTAMVGSSWIAANTAEGKNPTIIQVASGATVEAHVTPAYFGAQQLSFVSLMRGWVLLKGGRLLSTTDGGTTWTELSAGASGPNAYVQRARSLSMSVQSMQLLAPEVGIATAVSRESARRGKPQLMRTDDGGSHWREITPHFADSDKIVSTFFFLDPQHGWIVVWHWAPVPPPNSFSQWWHGDKPVRQEFEPAFELVSTTDGGASWSRTQMEIPRL
jgi:photosystem II stability/assembly factor-like uncharacterized protein